MMPLVDVHCHLLAGLDDGPRTWDEVLAMCRIALADGTQVMAATAHQNDRWDQVTPERIREGTRHLAGLLREAGLPLTVVPSAEVMAQTDLEANWDQDRLLSVADRGQYLLVEMPHQVFVDLRPLANFFQGRGVRLILAHPERHPEWLHEPGAIEEMIDLGCLVQVSSGSVTHPATPADARALRDWFRRGCVHLVGSDGHSPRRRAPRMAGAYEQVCRWAGTAAADRIFSVNGLAALRGQPLRVVRPKRRRSWWLGWTG